VSGTIRLEIDGPVAEIVIDHAERRNALSQAMWAAIPARIDECRAARGVRAIILHGGTAGAFAAGADISEFEDIYATPERAATASRTIAAATSAVEDCPLPVIAAIEGACVGGGVSLAMASDIRIAGAGAKFGVTPGKLGLVYSAADTRRLIAAIGPSGAKDLLFTGRIIKAQEAQGMGLVDRLVPEGDALDSARRLAAEIAALAPGSIRATKAIIARLLRGAPDDDPEAERQFLNGFSSDDFKEGYSAFLEKRPPAFRDD
jgi:enoyl-CoA hydratase/carnithine racemase